jgi:hypothetical protein
MERYKNLVRIIFFLVAVLHCVGLIKNSFTEIGELETYNIEISDLDSNESDSEEREEEEQKFFSYDYCKENNSKSLIFLNNSSKSNFLFYHFNIQTEILAVIESPPEVKLS